MQELPTPPAGGLRYQLSDGGLEVEFCSLTEVAWPGGGGHAYGRLPDDLGPQAGALTIRGIPEGTTCISVWMCEWAKEHPQAFGGRINTASVLLYARGTKARVQFHDIWEEHIPAALHILYC